MSEERLGTDDLTFGQKMGVHFMNVMGWGWNRHPVPFNAELVRTFGTRKAIEYLTVLGNISTRAEKLWGEADSQMMVGMSAFWNGCLYCSVGHVRAANIAIHRDRKLLCPLTHYRIPALSELKDGEAISAIRKSLAGDDYASTRRLANRMYELKIEGAESTGSDEDEMLLALVDGWSFLNDCSILSGVDARADRVPPLSIVAKDKALVQRYQDALGAADMIPNP
ncbi:MAG: hypothetical protein AB8I08_17370 [Sandaracinaceae bacterium]